MLKRPEMAVVAALVIAVGSGLAIYAQKRPSYTLSEVQQLRLKDKQKDALLFQVQFNQVQAQLQEKMNAFYAECDAVKKENNLPTGAVCDIQKPGTVNPPQATPPTPAAKQEPNKK